jgi:hypothetical protein
MTLSALFVVAITFIGGWALIFTGRLLNVRQTQPSLLLVIRVLFIIAAVVLSLIWIGAIPNLMTRP